MRHAKRVTLTLLLACSWLLGQTNPQQRMHDALVLEQQGQFDQAIAIINQLTSSHQLRSQVALGRAYIMLGVAYHQSGNFNLAQPAFEQSLRLLERDPDHASDYAAALHNYAALYNDSGQLEAATRMWLKALHLRQQAGNHAAVTRSLTALAGVALAQARVRQAGKYLEQASAEAKLAGLAGNELTDDDLAVLSEAQAWLALSQGNVAAAVEGYQRALDLCERTRGEQHWLTGWEYLLLGKAYSRSGNINTALADMRKGLEILDHALGRKNPKYFAGQFAYSQVLDQTGSHEEAARLRKTTERATKEFYGHECVGCTINVTAFR